MNCTENYFTLTVRVKNPHKYMDDYKDHTFGFHYIFALDTPGEAVHGLHWKIANASHIWESGAVIKDSDHSFTQITTSNGAQPTFATGTGIYTVPPGQTVIYTIGGGGSGSQTVINPANTTITLPVLEENRYNASIPLDLYLTKKCKCGSHSVGSNKHSDYCDLFTKESA